MRIRKWSMLFAMALGTMGTAVPLSHASSAEPAFPIEITEQNWESHPTILEIRKLYNDIQSALEKKTLKYREKNYSRLPRSCRGMFPTEYVAIATDSAKRVRMYVMAYRISHDDLLTTRSYYDDQGHLRFIYMTNESREYAKIENRIYLTQDGGVLWDVEDEAHRRTFGKFVSEPSELDHMSTQMTTEGLMAEFDSMKVRCSAEGNDHWTSPHDPAHIENSER